MAAKLIGAAAAALGALLIAAAPAGAAPVPPDATYQEALIESGDGTRLHLDVFRPRAGGETPVILIPGRYFAWGDVTDLEQSNRLAYYDDLFARAFARGYTVVQLTVRGYGESGGCTDFTGPRERDDVVAGIRWAARQPWSTGKVGTYGLSYDGMLQFAAMSRRLPEHAAAVPIGSMGSQYRAFYMRGLRYHSFSLLQGPYTLLFTPPSPGPHAAEAGLRAVLERTLRPGCPLETLNWANPDPGIPYWRERDYEAEAADTQVPILWSQGLLDWSIHPDGVGTLWPRLRGPKRLWLGQHSHLVPSEWERGHPEVVGRQGWTDEVFRWFDRHLKGLGTETDPAIVVQEGAEGRWRAEDTWPPADARDSAIPIMAGSYLDGPGTKGEPFCFRAEPPCIPGSTGRGSWTLTQPLSHEAHLSGTPRLQVDVAPPLPGAHVVGLLYDVDPAGRAALISRGGAVARTTGILGVELYQQDWLLRSGHRLGLLLAGTDDWWFEPGHTLVPVRVRGGSLRVPFLARARTSFLPGGPSQAIRQRSTFQVPAAALAGRTVSAPPPPRLEP